jgi:hypothetical protein
MTNLIAAPHAYLSCLYFGSSTFLGVRLEVSIQTITAEKMKLTSVVFTATLRHEKDGTCRGARKGGETPDVGDGCGSRRGLGSIHASHVVRGGKSYMRERWREGLSISLGVS